MSMTMQSGELLPSSNGSRYVSRYGSSNASRHVLSHASGNGPRFRSDARAAAGRIRMRLTLRGKIVTGLLAALMCFAGLTVGVRQAQSSTLPQQVTSYTVRPGETMWSYASDITPAGGNVNETIDRLVRLNKLHSTNLQVGQRLIVPQQDAEG